jgi:hypothetical protein
MAPNGYQLETSKVLPEAKGKKVKMALKELRGTKVFPGTKVRRVSMVRRARRVKTELRGLPETKERKARKV